ncbi:MAG: PatB family C-S lyase [Desulfobacteraceae bacterium]|jgi:cystathionine beta-lyase
MQNFDKPVDRTETDSIKWRKYHGRDIIPMWVADMDFESPPAVLESLHERIDHGIFGYALPDKQHRSAVVEYIRKQFRWNISAQWIVWLPGVVSGLNVACRSVGDAGDSIVTAVPVYPPILSAPKNWDRRLRTTRMIKTVDGWQLDMDDLERALTPDACLFILCNPHNPTGRVLRKAELEQIAQYCLKRNLVICADEIHCDLVLEPGLHHIPIASLSPEINQQTITLMAPSKTFNIPGLGCSFAIIANDALRSQFKKSMNGIVPDVNVLGLTAARAAYQKGQPWLEALRRYLRANRNLVFQRINAMPGLHMTPVEGTYLAWIDISQLNLSHPARWFEKAGIGLSDGRDFDGEGYLRLNFGCSQSLLTTGLDRMANAIEKRNG